MKCELIVACTKDGIIGYNNKIPWHIPEDLKYFRNTTLNSIVIMGRKTFESLPNGYLKNRINIVITNKKLLILMLFLQIMKIFFQLLKKCKLKKIEKYL